MRGPAAMARRTSDRDRAPEASGAPTTPTGMAVPPAAASGRFEVVADVLVVPAGWYNAGAGPGKADIGKAACPSPRLLIVFFHT